MRLVMADPKNGLGDDFNPTSSYKVKPKTRVVEGDLVIAECVDDFNEESMVMVEIKAKPVPVVVAAKVAAKVEPAKVEAAKPIVIKKGDSKWRS